MAETTITALPAASAVAATDVLPADIAAASATQKVTVQGLVDEGLKAPGTIGGTTPGVAYFTGVVADDLTGDLTSASVDINGGTIDGASVGATTASSGAFTDLASSGTVSGTGFSDYLASPPAIGVTAPSAGKFTTLDTTGNVVLGDASGDTLTITGTAVSIPNNLNFDSNTLYIDAANNRVGVGVVPTVALDVAGAGFKLRQSSNSANTSVSLDTTTQNALTLDSSGNLAIVGSASSKKQITLPDSGNGNITRVVKGVSVSGTTSTCTITFNSATSWQPAVVRVRCACVATASSGGGAAETIYSVRAVSSAATVAIATTAVTTSAGLVLSTSAGNGTMTITATVATGVNILWDVEVSSFRFSTDFSFA